MDHGLKLKRSFSNPPWTTGVERGPSAAPDLPTAQGDRAADFDLWGKGSSLEGGSLFRPDFGEKLTLAVT